MPENLISISDILNGSRLAGARLIRMSESGESAAFDLMADLFPHGGRAFVMGITGSPGSGKSSLMDRLITEFRAREFSVGVVAVDPSSPTSGGAILGDRVRMQNHATDDKVFIRSMASRGETGGLARAARDAVLVMDAMGFEVILVETVGAGQSEVSVTGLAHSVAVVTIPGAGDGVQALKAGILETGDLLVVNKGDLAGADVAAFHLETMLEMRSGDPAGWQPRVVRTCAKTGEGITELADLFLAHRDFQKESGILAEKRAARDREYFQNLVQDLAKARMEETVRSAFNGTGLYRELTAELAARKTDPFRAARKLVDKICPPLGAL